MNRGELYQAIRDTTKNQQLTELELQRFVAGGIARIGVRARHRTMLVGEDLPGAGGPVPANLVEVKSLTYGTEMLTQLSVLTFQLEKSGRPRRFKRLYGSFCIQGDRFMLSKTYMTTGDLLYYQVPPLADVSTATNPTMDKYPDLFVLGACAHAFQYLQDPENMDAFGTAFDNELALVNLAANREDWGRLQRNSGF